MEEKEYIDKTLEQIRFMAGDDVEDVNQVKYILKKHKNMTPFDIIRFFYRLINELDLTQFYTEEEICLKSAKLFSTYVKLYGQLGEGKHDSK